MFDFQLEEMIQQQLVSRGITDKRLFKAVREIPRRVFVPDYLTNRMFDDECLPIGLGQTISPPYIMARMIQEVRLGPDSRVLEVGTGSGYQTALLSRMAAHVLTIEYLPELSARARRTLVDDMGLLNVTFLVGDGFQGWSDSAPFDAIIINAAADEIPWPLEGQLRAKGYLAMPVGDEREQSLVIARRPKVSADLEECFREELTQPFPMMEGEARE